MKEAVSDFKIQSAYEREFVLVLLFLFFGVSSGIVYGFWKWLLS